LCCVSALSSSHIPWNFRIITLSRVERARLRLIFSACPKKQKRRKGEKEKRRKGEKEKRRKGEKEKV